MSFYYTLKIFGKYFRHPLALSEEDFYCCYSMEFLQTLILPFLCSYKLFLTFVYYLKNKIDCYNQRSVSFYWFNSRTMIMTAITITIIRRSIATTKTADQSVVSSFLPSGCSSNFCLICGSESVEFSVKFVRISTSIVS